MKKPTLPHKGNYRPQSMPGSPQASIVTISSAASPESIKSLSSSASLSGTSSRSSSSRSFRTYKATSFGSRRRRARLLPKAHKRGGKDKPIVVQDSSSIEMLCQELHKPQESGTGLKLDEIDLVAEAPGDSQLGPVETLNELRRVLQSISNKVPKARRKYSKKEKAKRSPVKRRSAQNLGQQPGMFRSSFINISEVVADSGTSSQGTGTDAIALDSMARDVGDSSALETEDVKAARPFQFSGPACKGDYLGAPDDERDDSSEKPSISPTTTMAESCKAVNCSPDTGSTAATLYSSFLNRTTPNKEGVQYFKLVIPTQRQMKVVSGSSDGSVKIVETLARPNIAPLCPEILKDDDRDMHAFPLLGTQMKDQQARFHEMLRAKRMRHRDRTPQQILWGKPIDIYQRNPLLPSSILAQTWTGFHSESVKVSMPVANHKYEESNTPDKPITFGIVSGAPAAQSLEDVLDVGETGGLVSNGEGPGSRDDSLLIPRTWIDENKLEAQSTGKTNKVTVQENQIAAAFNPGATVSLLLGIVTYPLKVVWRIAYGA